MAKVDWALLCEVEAVGDHLVVSIGVAPMIDDGIYRFAAKESIMFDSTEVARFIVALFASGVFWLMVLFFIEKAWLRSPLPGAWLMAVLVMTLSALALFTVVDDGAWRLVASQTISAPGGEGTRTHGQN
jgi:hypothetical protein